MATTSLPPLSAPAINGHIDDETLAKEPFDNSDIAEGRPTFLSLFAFVKKLPRKFHRQNIVPTVSVQVAPPARPGSIGHLRATISREPVHQVQIPPNDSNQQAARDHFPSEIDISTSNVPPNLNLDSREGEDISDQPTGSNSDAQCPEQPSESSNPATAILDPIRLLNPEHSASVEIPTAADQLPVVVQKSLASSSDPQPGIISEFQRGPSSVVDTRALQESHDRIAALPSIQEDRQPVSRVLETPPPTTSQHIAQTSTTLSTPIRKNVLALKFKKVGPNLYEATNMQPPQALRDRWSESWRRTINRQLMQLHLGPNVVTNLRLAMVGPEPQETCMQPTILLICPETKRREIENKLRDFLAQFVPLVDFKISSGSVKFSAGDLGSLSQPGESTDLFVHINSDVRFPSLMGKIAYLEVAHEDALYRSAFTIGGIVSVGKSLYALTVAHSLCVESSPAMENESPQNRDAGGQIHSYEWSGNKSSQDIVDVVAPGMDWMLIRITQQFCFPNTFVRDERGPQPHISGFLRSGSLSDGDVWVCAGVTGVQAGVLSSIASSIIYGQVVYEVMSVALDHPLEEGDSGSWVIRGDKLCGYIIARLDGQPWAYMMPIEKVFNKIADVYSRKEGGFLTVDIPNEAKIHQLREFAPKTLPRISNLSTSFLSAMPGNPPTDEIVINNEFLISSSPPPSIRSTRSRITLVGNTEDMIEHNRTNDDTLDIEGGLQQNKQVRHSGSNPNPPDSTLPRNHIFTPWQIFGKKRNLVYKKLTRTFLRKISFWVVNVSWVIGLLFAIEVAALSRFHVPDFGKFLLIVGYLAIVAGCYYYIWLKLWPSDAELFGDGRLDVSESGIELQDRSHQTRRHRRWHRRRRQSWDISE